MSLFRFQDVSIIINQQAILEETTMQFRENEIVGISGPSGTGKTTFLKIFNRLWEPSSGRVYYQDQLLENYDHTCLRREVILLFQEPLCSVPGLETISSILLLCPAFKKNLLRIKPLFKRWKLWNWLPALLIKTVQNYPGGRSKELLWPAAFFFNHGFCSWMNPLQPWTRN